MCQSLLQPLVGLISRLGLYRPVKSTWPMCYRASMDGPPPDPSMPLVHALHCRCRQDRIDRCRELLYVAFSGANEARRTTLPFFAVVGSAHQVFPFLFFFRNTLLDRPVRYFPFSFFSTEFSVFLYSFSERFINPNIFKYEQLSFSKSNHFLFSKYELF